jgi:hypothetical protein
MKLITYATHNSGYFFALQESAKNNNYDLVILGYGEEWQGFTQRIIDIKKYLLKLDKNDLVVFVDAFDCIILGSSSEMEKKYKSLNTNKVLFSAIRDNFILEKIFGPINPIDKEKEFNRLVAGCYIGYVGKILDLFDNMCSELKCNVEDDDQVKLTNYYSKCKNCLLLDYNSNLFYNIDVDKNLIFSFFDIISGTQEKYELPLDSQYYKFENGRIILNNGNKPLILHGNGNLNIDKFVNELKLTGKIHQNRNYYDYSTKKFFEKLRSEYPITTHIMRIILKLVHLFLVFYSFLLFFTTNSYIILSIIIFNTIILYLWYYNGYCILSPIENALDDSERTSKGSFLTEIGIKYLGITNMGEIISYLPVIFIIYASIKLVYLNKTCKLNKMK